VHSLEDRVNGRVFTKDSPRNSFLRMYRKAKLGVFLWICSRFSIIRVLGSFNRNIMGFAPVKK